KVRDSEARGYGEVAGGTLAFVQEQLHAGPSRQGREPRAGNGGKTEDVAVEPEGLLQVGHGHDDTVELSGHGWLPRIDRYMSILGAPAASVRSGRTLQLAAFQSGRRPRYLSRAATWSSPGSAGSAGTYAKPRSGSTTWRAASCSVAASGPVSGDGWPVATARSQAWTPASSAQAPAATATGREPTGSGVDTSLCSGRTACHAPSARRTASATRAVGAVPSTPEGVNGLSVGPGPPPTAAAHAAWSPVACCSSWATFHCSHGVGRFRSRSLRPPTTVASPEI